MVAKYENRKRASFVAYDIPTQNTLHRVID